MPPGRHLTAPARRARLKLALTRSYARPRPLSGVFGSYPLWTTRYLDAAVTQLRAQGHHVRDEDAARLSPLKTKHLNVLGRYAITASQPGEGLRPLRDPAATDEDEHD